MVRWIGKGWRDLYNIVRNYGAQCVALGRYYFILTEYGKEPLRDDEGNYAVQLRCGWREEHIPGLGGMVGGLTKEQWLFLKYSTPKWRAVLAVGPEWPGLEEARRRAIEAGVTVKI